MKSRKQSLTIDRPAGFSLSLPGISPKQRPVPGLRTAARPAFSVSMRRSVMQEIKINGTCSDSSDITCYQRLAVFRFFNGSVIPTRLFVDVAARRSSCRRLTPASLAAVSGRSFLSRTTQATERRLHRPRPQFSVGSLSRSRARDFVGLRLRRRCDADYHQKQ